MSNLNNDFQMQDEKNKINKSLDGLYTYLLLLMMIFIISISFFN